MFGADEDNADSADDLATLLRVIEASPPLVPLPASHAHVDALAVISALSAASASPLLSPAAAGAARAPEWLVQLEHMDEDQLLADTEALLNDGAVHQAHQNVLDDALLAHIDLDLDGSSGSRSGSHSGSDSAAQSIKKQQKKKKVKSTAREATSNAKRARQSALAAKRRNAYRQRMKQELHDLRTESAELSAKLKVIQEESEVPGKLRRYRGDSDVSTSSSSPTSVLVAPGWKGIAVRQMEGRLEAEALNRELRTQVSMNRALIQHISNALRLRINAVDAHRRRSLALAHQKRVRLEESDSRLFNTFLREVDDMYLKTDGVFRDCERLFKTDEPLTSNYRRKWDRETNSECVEFVDTIVVPFGFRKAPSALWRAMPVIFGKEAKPTIVAVGDPETTLAMKYHFIYYHDEERTPFQCCMLMKRYEERDRSVFVWRALSEGEGAVSAVQSVETGWCVVRPSPNGAAPTVFQFCTRVWPVHPPTTTVSENKDFGEEVEHLVDLMMRSSEDETVDMARAIENVLLEDTVAARDDGAAAAAP